jgi:hypothetical protein
MGLRKTLRERLARWLEPEEVPEPPKRRLIYSYGIAKVTSVDEIPEPYADATTKDSGGERYLGLNSHAIYLVVPDEERDPDG